MYPLYKQRNFTSGFAVNIAAASGAEVRGPLPQIWGRELPN